MCNPVFQKQVIDNVCEITHVERLLKKNRVIDIFGDPSLF